MDEGTDGLVSGPDGKARCWWCAGPDDYRDYHDAEWGLPVTDDVRLFEKLCLEGFQAGLSWLTILRKREGFRRAFAGFDFEKVSRFRPEKVEKILLDASIVRHRGKIESVLNNAKRVREVVAAEGSLAAMAWRFEPPPNRRPERVTKAAVCALAKSRESEALSKELKRRGFSFVGPTTVYAFMQAMGLVNDHVEGCFVRPRVEAARRRLRRPL